ncbi:MAG: 6-carboxyhexanoate--CoA ligase [Desulfurobacteriaceae bacterium]
MEKKLYSVKMRSSKNGFHISGAERIVSEKEIEKVSMSLIKRALNHSRGKPDFINLKVEEIKEEIVYISPLPIFEITGFTSPYEVLKKLFDLARIPIDLGLEIYERLFKGPTMRGAMIVEVPSGKRLDPDKERGVRASYLDMDKETERKLKEVAGKGYTQNLKEALTLSTKILSFEGVLAELCVSDDPDYTTGYFSIKGRGYFRIKNIKSPGLPRGGRAIFVKDIELSSFIEYLEKKPIIVKGEPFYSLFSI